MHRLLLIAAHSLCQCLLAAFRSLQLILPLHHMLCLLSGPALLCGRACLWLRRLGLLLMQTASQGVWGHAVSQQHRQGRSSG